MPLSLFDLIRSQADRTSLARSQACDCAFVATTNRFPKLSGQHPRPDHPERARVSGRRRRPQVQDIFPQVVEVELPGDDTPARGGAPKGDALLSPSSARCHGSARTAAAAASQKVPPTMTAAHPAGRKSRRQHLARHRRPWARAGSVPPKRGRMGWFDNWLLAKFLRRPLQGGVFPDTLKRFPDQRSRIPCYSPQGISP